MEQSTSPLQNNKDFLPKDILFLVKKESGLIIQYCQNISLGGYVIVIWIASKHFIWEVILLLTVLAVVYLSLLVNKNMQGVFI